MVVAGGGACAGNAAMPGPRPPSCARTQSAPALLGGGEGGGEGGEEEGWCAQRYQRLELNLGHEQNVGLNLEERLGGLRSATVLLLVTYICICIYVCMYIYIYMYICIYVYMYICICSHIGLKQRRNCEMIYTLYQLLPLRCSACIYVYTYVYMYIYIYIYV